MMMKCEKPHTLHAFQPQSFIAQQVFPKNKDNLQIKFAYLRDHHFETSCLLMFVQKMNLRLKIQLFMFSYFALSVGTTLSHSRSIFP